MAISHPGEHEQAEYGPFPGSLSLAILRHDGLVTCYARGSMDSAHAEMLERRLGDLAREAPGELVVDLTEVEFLGSAGVTALLMARRVAEERGGRVRVTGAPGHARRTLELAGLLGTLGL